MQEAVVALLQHLAVGNRKMAARCRWGARHRSDIYMSATSKQAYSMSSRKGDRPLHREDPGALLAYPI